MPDRRFHALVALSTIVITSVLDPGGLWTRLAFAWLAIVIVWPDES